MGLAEIYHYLGGGEEACKSVPQPHLSPDSMGCKPRPLANPGGAQQQRRLCDRQVGRCQAVREGRVAVFPDQERALSAWHRAVQLELRALAT